MAQKLTIAVGMARPYNNFDLFRLIAASLIAWLHAIIFVAGNSDNHPLLLSFGRSALSAFFIMSGFLITQSYLNRDNLIEYMASRVLRLFPSLWLCILFCALILGPLVTTLSLHDYFTNPEVWRFIKFNALLHLYYTLPGVFTNNPIPYAVNSSLWTLLYEFKLYVVIGLFGVLGILKHPYLRVICALGILGALYATNNFAYFYYCFVLGALANFFKEKIVLSPWILIGLYVICWLLRNTGFLYFSVSYIALAYLCFCLAYMPFLRDNYITRYGDFSYSVYIYAFPIQQTFMHFFHFKSAWTLSLSAMPVIYTIAAFSWFYIERPALRQKRRIHAFLNNLSNKFYGKKIHRS